ncbi:hypothetical protein GUITHDRAFT_153981 [Guillardia theta CCMP2712]|uniref:Uncharacterized protein n=2 Tax=Guillardia theta TaxID=55529 RepID=L1IY32_GUITC|nr:hypothetical protein GUITHDRAFT_153981 [Guillardia theta CCMP2712]EKX41017.1 hypothetical protein GUITHDRAFT_153981 [Guillardia theta CCMP2712]|mmetsp:Transcript_43500/g.137592  ORF Transcript_43500/g.137592 Transcript_43500/m.137592 type:complete len:217 (+) Transcript_43500:210-860(+)|eukprot:XP_005827997.1 hypothetical protein GUITHDRAFT_153981 [Guillardia theta CCMP2712]
MKIFALAVLFALAMPVTALNYQSVQPAYTAQASAYDMNQIHSLPVPKNMEQDYREMRIGTPYDEEEMYHVARVASIRGGMGEIEDFESEYKSMRMGNVFEDNEMFSAPRVESMRGGAAPHHTSSFYENQYSQYRIGSVFEDELPAPAPAGFKRSLSLRGGGADDFEKEYREMRMGSLFDENEMEAPRIDSLRGGGEVNSKDVEKSYSELRIGSVFD